MAGHMMRGITQRWHCARFAGGNGCKKPIPTRRGSPTKADLAQSAIPSAMVGHVGDGNFHLVFMIDPKKPEEIAEASRLNDRMVARALAMEGTCTGEHGIGYGKIDFLFAEHGDALGVMVAVKRALDPDNIMNPGKIVRV